MTAGKGDRIQRIDAEVAENLRLQEDQAAQQRRLKEFFVAWEKRGERFDRLLDRMEEVLGRLGPRE